MKNKNKNDLNYISIIQRKPFIIKKEKIRTVPKRSEELSARMRYLKENSKIDDKGNIEFSEEIKIIE